MPHDVEIAAAGGRVRRRVPAPPPCPQAPSRAQSESLSPESQPVARRCISVSLTGSAAGAAPFVTRDHTVTVWSENRHMDPDPVHKGTRPSRRICCRRTARPGSGSGAAGPPAQGSVFNSNLQGDSRMMINLKLLTLCPMMSKSPLRAAVSGAAFRRRRLALRLPAALSQSH